MELSLNTVTILVIFAYLTLAWLKTVSSGNAVSYTHLTLPTTVIV